MYRRATARLAARATAYYSPAGTVTAPAAPRRWFLRPGAVAVVARALVSVLLTVAVLLTVLFADLEIAASHWLAALLLLIAVSGLYAVLLHRRRHRRHQRRHQRRG